MSNYRLGVETGSLVNYLEGHTVSQEPAIGTAATLLFWTDRRAGTVVAVENGIVTVQEDTSLRTDANGLSESQEYRYLENPEGILHTFKRGKGIRKGFWNEVERNEATGRWVLVRGGGTRVVFGRKETYTDPSF